MIYHCMRMRTIGPNLKGPAVVRTYKIFSEKCNFINLSFSDSDVRKLATQNIGMGDSNTGSYSRSSCYIWGTVPRQHHVCCQSDWWLNNRRWLVQNRQTVCWIFEILVIRNKWAQVPTNFRVPCPKIWWVVKNVHQWMVGCQYMYVYTIHVVFWIKWQIHVCLQLV